MPVAESRTARWRVGELVGGLGRGPQAALWCDSRTTATKHERHPMAKNTDWFRKARWGVFNHYLAYGASHQGGAGVTPEEWNARVDSFDVPGLVAQLREIGAA